MIDPFVHSAAARVERTGDVRIDGVLSLWTWTDRQIAYSDPDDPVDYGGGYFSDEDGDGRSAELQRFTPLNSDQRAVVQAALDCGYAGARPALAGFAVEGFTKLSLVYAGPGSGKAELRIANSADPDGAYAYLPDPTAEGGDVWFGGAGGDPALANYDFLTVIHELGHALGLKHGHADNAFGAVPRTFDSLEYTVMTYRSFIGASTSDYDAFERYGAPQSFMMFDIAALQHLYGANFEVNSGDTLYAWLPGDGATRVNGEIALRPEANRIFATVWDGGGNDTYDLSRYETAVRINLDPGGHSLFGDRQLAYLGGGPNEGYARGNIFNALQYRDDPRSLIENAIGGSGADRIGGNAADNLLKGRRGSDWLRGEDGNDRLVGGKGYDRLHGGDGADDLAGGLGRDMLRGGWGADTFRFSSPNDSARRKVDRLLPTDGAEAFEGAGRRGGDLIDVSRIDADQTRKGDQAFVLGDAPSIGSIWLRDRDGDTLLRARVDIGKDFKLIIEDGSLRAEAYAPEDFIL